MIVSADTTHDTERLELIEMISINRMMLTDHIVTFESIFAFKYATSPPRNAQIEEGTGGHCICLFPGRSDAARVGARCARPITRRRRSALPSQCRVAREKTRKRVREDMRGIVGRPSASGSSRRAHSPAARIEVNDAAYLPSTDGGRQRSERHILRPGPSALRFGLRAAA